MTKLRSSLLPPLLSLALIFAGAHASDQLTDASFLIDFADFSPLVENENGRATIITGTANPGLMGNGATVAEVSLEPGAILQPHLHPRATEILRVLKGSFRSCFVQEFGGGRFCNDLSEGQVQVLPMDTIHYQQNTGSETAVFYSVLNNDNPGTFFFPNALFELPTEALSAAFDVKRRDINEIRQGFPPIPAPQRANLAPSVAGAIRRSEF